MEPTAERGYSKLEWFFYIIILPVIFISILSVSLIWFLDDDLKESFLSTLNQVPLIEKLIDDEQFKEEEVLSINSSKEHLLNAVDTLKQNLTEKESSINQFEKSSFSKDEEINKLKQQIEELNLKLQEKNSSALTREQEIAEVAKIYTNMSPQNAAKLISNLTTEEALLILDQMNTDMKSKIFEEMEQKKAADLSILLKDFSYSKDKDISALQERIKTLTEQVNHLKENKFGVDYQQLAITFSNMTPNKSAETILSIYRQNSKKAKNIIATLDPVSRSRILNEMEASDVAKLTIDLVD